MRDYLSSAERDDRATDDYIDRDPGVTPGKVSLTSKLQVMRKADGAVQDADNAQALIERARAGGGQALPAHLQTQFGSSLGASLEGVRVHTGGAASEAASALGARAFTVGNDVVFGEGQYDHTSADGLHLIAHEVAHTVQQTGVSSPTPANKNLSVSEPGDSLEREADAAADAMVAGGAAKVNAGGAGVVHREKAKAKAQPKITVADGKTKVAIGEKVNFTGSDEGTWKASSGKPTTGDKGTQFEWTAGTKADTATITLDVDGQQATTQIQVVAPTGLKFVHAGALIKDESKAGNGMLLNVFVEPLDVKFNVSGKVVVNEKDVAASGVSGYFAKHGGDHAHKAFAAGAYVQSGNKLDEQDRAASAGYDPPYEAGSFSWVIPTTYTVFGADDAGPHDFFTSTQTFTMDEKGGVTVTKGGATTGLRPAPPEKKKSSW
jgi:hypothetical protein